MRKMERRTFLQSSTAFLLCGLAGIALPSRSGGRRLYRSSTEGSVKWAQGHSAGCVLYAPDDECVCDEFPREYFWGGCQRCKKAWPNGSGDGPSAWHSTWYERQRGIIALCEGCWAILTPQQRLPFYRAVYDNPTGGWRDHVAWIEIEKSVLNEPRFQTWF